MTEALPLVDNIAIFRQLETYPWDKDKEFQVSLANIHSSHPSSAPLISLGNEVKNVLDWREERAPIRQKLPMEALGKYYSRSSRIQTLKRTLNFNVATS